MGGVVKTIGRVLTVAGNFIPGIGPILMLAGAALTVAGSVLQKKPAAPQVSPATSQRLNANIEPRTGRKTWVGVTAGSTDIRDQEYTDDQTYLQRFIVCAAHRIEAYDEIWLDDKLAWTFAGGVQGEFVGYLSVNTVKEGSAANAINISPRMGSTRIYTGCAYVLLGFKLTGNTSGTDSPFAQSVPTRITIKGKGAWTYDPRLDSTVAGGSGSHRANDQTTWTWSSASCRNPAIQLLFYLLGWRINGILSVGLGIPADRIDLESFITAANLCDEDVTLAAGGTEPRYRSDGVWSETDDPKTVVDMLKASMNADLDDAGGKLRLTVFHNDLASPIASFGPHNFIAGIRWDQTPALNDSFNIVRGAYTDPSDASLYQQVDYPEAALPSVDGIDRIDPFNVPLVQSASQAQRLAKQRLQRQQYSGQLTSTLDVEGWKVLKNDPILITLPVLGFTNKPFRVAEIEQGLDGQVPVVLREENTDIYAWDADERAPVVAAAPTLYDRALNPIVQAIEAIPGAVPNGANMLVNYAFGDGLNQWALVSTGAAGNGTLVPSSGKAVLASTAPSGSTDAIFAAMAPYDGSATYNGHHLFRVIPLQRLAWRIKGTVSRTNARVTPFLRFLNIDASATLTGSAYGDAAGTFPGYARALRNGVVEAAGYIDVPTTSGMYWFDLQITGLNESGTGAVSCTLEAVQISFIDTDQVVPPAWAAGPSTPYTATRNFPRGDYDGAATYYPGDIVVWTVVSGGDGNSYQRIGDTATTGTNPSNATYWVLFNSRGEQGESALSVSALPPSISVPCTPNGTPKSAIPGFAISAFRGTTDVTATASYAVLAASGLTGLSHAGSGVFVVSGMSADKGYVLVEVDGSQQVQVPYTKALDGAAYVYDQIAISQPTSTSYVEIGRITLLMGPNGTLAASSDGFFQRNGTGSANVDGYVEVSLNGSSWTNIGNIVGVAATIPNGTGSFASDDGSGGGILSISGATLGLVTKQNVYIRVMMRKAAGADFSDWGGGLSSWWNP